MLGLLLEPDELVDLGEDGHLLCALAGRIVRIIGHLGLFLEVGAVLAQIAEAVLVPRLLEGLLDVLFAFLGCEFLVHLCLHAFELVQIGLIACLEGGWGSGHTNCIFRGFNDMRNSFFLDFHRLAVFRWQLGSFDWLRWLAFAALFLRSKPYPLIPDFFSRLLLLDRFTSPIEEILEFCLLGWKGIAVVLIGVEHLDLLHLDRRGVGLKAESVPAAYLMLILGDLLKGEWFVL